MGQINKLKDKSGTTILPVTVADAVYIEGKTLAQYLLTMQDSPFIKTEEDGFFICDSSGWCIAAFDDGGMDSVLSERLKEAIRELGGGGTGTGAAEFTIDGDAANRLFSYRRLTDGEYMETGVYRSVVYLGDMEAGAHEMVLEGADYLMRDWFNIQMNVPHTVTAVSFSGRRLTVGFSLPAAMRRVTAIVDYTVMSDENYDRVTISVATANTDAVPEIARVKYNSLCPFVWTSNDMGAGEFSRAWCFFNGYVTGAVTDKWPKGNDVLNGVNMGTSMPIHRPLTYDDGTGGRIRYAGTSAIWPHSGGGGNYTYMRGADAAIMIRTGHSFAQHDVDKAGDAAFIASRFGPLSELWAEEYTGIPLKVMVEPNGNHDYVAATVMSPEMCLAVYQNSTAEYPPYSALIDDWCAGQDYSSFRHKSMGALTRDFIQGKEYNLYNAITNADGTSIIITGSHGMGKSVQEWLLTNVAAKRDDLWVCSVDELWEYYHLHNNSIIDNVRHEDGRLTFDMIVPRYYKHQFRELTVNIPVTDGADCAMSDNVITGSAGQAGGVFTVNFGLEESIYQYITETIELLKQFPANCCLRRDSEYLIGRLVPGTARTAYETMLAGVAGATYTLSVIVRDADGNAVTCAEGVLTAEGDTYTAAAMVNGELCFANVTPGTGTLTVSAEGYAVYTAEVAVSGNIIMEDITLEAE